MKGGIERSLADGEDVVGNLLDALSDGPAVLGLDRDGLQDEHVQRALQEIGGWRHGSPPTFDNRIA